MEMLKLTLGDKSFDARPSFRAVARIEAQTGRAIFDMAADPTTIRLTDMAAILHAPIAEAGHKITQEDIGDLIVECGMQETVSQVVAVFNAVMSPGPKEAPASGETKSAGS